MGGIGVPELLIILALVVLLFGARKLPDLAGSVGKSIREFRKATDEADREQAERDEARRREQERPDGPSRPDGEV